MLPFNSPEIDESPVETLPNSGSGVPLIGLAWACLITFLFVSYKH